MDTDSRRSLLETVDDKVGVFGRRISGYRQAAVRYGSTLPMPYVWCLMFEIRRGSSIGRIQTDAVAAVRPCFSE